MTEEHLKALAEITVLNTAVLSKVIGFCAKLTEKVLPLIARDQEAVSLLSDLDQLNAAMLAAQPALDQARREVGL